VHCTLTHFYNLSIN